jgi:amidase
LGIDARTAEIDVNPKETWAQSASELSQSIRLKQVSCVEVVEAALQRIADINPDVNAVVEILGEQALDLARRHDSVLAGSDPQPGPLFGVPFTAKINVDVAGLATTNGVAAFSDLVAIDDNPCIRNLRDAGGICIGRTNVPAFSARYFTDNEFYGRTLNPWNKAITPGGSSGGAAVAVATGMGALSHGNDRAGSIRLPAHAAGIFGIRPTLGRVPSFDGTARFEPTLGSRLTNVQGCFGRSIADVRLGLHAMSAASSRDPWWNPAPFLSIEKPRVGIVSNWPATTVDSGAMKTLAEVTDRLRKSGYEVINASPPNLDEAALLFWSLISSEDNGQVQSMVDKFGDAPIRKARRSTLNYAPSVSIVDDYIALMQRRTEIIRDIMTFLDTCPVLVLPISLGAPIPIDADQNGDRAVHDMLDAYRPLTAVSLLGLPSLAVPCGVIDGLPRGVQIVSGRYHEETCLGVGEIIARYQPAIEPIDPLRA